MAHFAKLNAQNEVIAVLVGRDQDTETELSQKTGDTYKQTSYNTRGGVHILGGTPLRKNFAGIGMVYDPAKDAFLAKKPSVGVWELDEASCIWYEVIDDAVA